MITSRSATKIVGETPTGSFAITGSISDGRGVLDFTYSNANGDWTDVYVVNSASDIAMSGVEYETGPDAPAPSDPATACQDDPSLDCTAWSAIRGATCTFASTMGRPGSAQAPEGEAGGKYYFAGHTSRDGVQLLYSTNCPPTTQPAIGIVWTSKLDCGANADQQRELIRHQFSARGAGVTLTNVDGQIEFNYTTQFGNFEATILLSQNDATVNAEYSGANGCHSQIVGLTLKRFKKYKLSF